MTNILFRLFDLEIRNKQIIEEKEKSVGGFGEGVEAQSIIVG
jgi:hypothetical protein